MPNARRPNATYIPLTGVGGWRRGTGNANFRFGVGGNANFSVLKVTPKYTNMLVHFALGDAKVWHWV